MITESKGETKSSREELEEVVVFAAKTAPKSKDNLKYATYFNKEIGGQRNRGIFVPSTVKDAREHRIHKSRFVDFVKNEGTLEAFEKSRFVVSAFEDDVEFLTHAPTVIPASQRLLPSIA